VVPRPPDVDTLFPKIYAYLASHRAGIELSQLLALLASLLGLVFIVYLVSVLRSTEGDRPLLSALVLAGGLGSLVVGWVASAVVLVTAAMTHQSTDGGLRGLYDLSRFLDTFTVAPLVLFLGATAAVVIATRVLPLLLGWAAAVLAVLLLVAACVSISQPTTLEGTAGRVLFLLFALWVAAASVILSLRAWPARATT
jgi:hypothetical protein